MADVPHEVISLGHLFAGLSPLTNTAEKLELYESAEKLPGGLEKTFVPGRNILFLSVAANRAYVLDCHSLVIGVSQEDFGGYPDCREDFIDKMKAALASGLDYKLQIYAPLMKWTKNKLCCLLKICQAAWKRSPIRRLVMKALSHHALIVTPVFCANAVLQKLK